MYLEDKVCVCRTQRPLQKESVVEAESTEREMVSLYLSAGQRLMTHGQTLV